VAPRGGPETSSSAQRSPRSGTPPVRPGPANTQPLTIAGGAPSQPSPSCSSHVNTPHHLHIQHINMIAPPHGGEIPHTTHTGTGQHTHPGRCNRHHACDCELSQSFPTPANLASGADAPSRPRCALSVQSPLPPSERVSSPCQCHPQTAHRKRKRACCRSLRRPSSTRSTIELCSRCRSFR